MFSVQSTFKHQATFLKVFFAFVLCTLFFVLSHTATHASWTYDKDQPKIKVTLTCGDNIVTSISYDPAVNGPATINGAPNPNYYATPGTSWNNGDLGSCYDNGASLTVQCDDLPASTGASLCKYLQVQSSHDNAFHSVQNPNNSTSISYTFNNISSSTNNGVFTLGTVGGSACTEGSSYTCAVDNAGNITVLPTNATFNFAQCSITAPSFSATEGSTGVEMATASYGGNTNKYTYSATVAPGGESFVRIDSTTGTYPTYTSNISALSRGNTTFHLSGKVNNKEICYADPQVSITAVGPWWQVTDNDIYSSGNITSTIPGTCIGSCVNKFDLDGTGNYPGIPVYASGTAYWGDPATGAVVSSRGWLANSSYTGRTYDYAWFLNQTAVPADLITAAGSPALLGTTADNAALNTGLTSNGTIYRYAPGNLTINEDINVGTNKVVLFVAGNLTINKKINITSNGSGTGFFAAIVDGSTSVDGTVTNGTSPALEGFYLSDGTFNTGTSASRLIVRGAVAAYGGVTLARDLGTPNTVTPAESFIYAPDLVLSMPYALMRQGIKWNEINP